LHCFFAIHHFLLCRMSVIASLRCSLDPARCLFL
jgi:hypothetical protein